MILYNVTYKVEWSVHEDWLLWMQQVHGPGMISTGYLSDYRVYRLLEIDDNEGPTYAVQYHAATRNDYNMFIENESVIQWKKETDKWQNNFVAFGTIMQAVN